MIDRVERLPRPEPDINRVLAVLRRERPDRIPFLEIKLDNEVMSALLDEPFVPLSRNTPADLRRKSIRQTAGLMHRLGFDAFRLRADIPLMTVKDKAADTADLSRGQREWQNEHSGPIQNMEDFEHYPWPKPEDIDYGPLEEIFHELPDGMACIGYFSGVFEWSSWLMGLQTFMLALIKQPELVRGVTDRVGELLYAVVDAWCHTDGVPIIWMGDDLGFKTNTMVHPKHLRTYVLPWYRKYVELAHRHGKPFMLHSCGNLKAIMPDLVDDIRIDAKHSFEDVIQPVEEFAREWGGKTAVVGGVDIDILGRGTETQVKARTLEILESCAPRGGYAAGSGNSVPNYVPVNNYLAMLETIHQFNGRM